MKRTGKGVGLVGSTGGEGGEFTPPLPERDRKALQVVREADYVAMGYITHRTDRVTLEKVKRGWMPSTFGEWSNVHVLALLFQHPPQRPIPDDGDPDHGPVSAPPGYWSRINAIVQRLQSLHQILVDSRTTLDQVRSLRPFSPKPTYSEMLAVYDTWVERMRLADLPDEGDFMRQAWALSDPATRGPEPWHPDDGEERWQEDYPTVGSPKDITRLEIVILTAQERLDEAVGDDPWIAFRLGLGPDPSIRVPAIAKPVTPVRDAGTDTSIRKARERARTRGHAIAPHWAGSQSVMYDDVVAKIGLRRPGTTLDRIKNPRGYVPGNVRWATKSQQRDNQDRNPRPKKRR